ncbi:MAG: hypothetical protein HC846_06535 [Blastocatellia bacterium]|nr:hypothetical protein [Blastocatellia bacterium]
MPLDGNIETKGLRDAIKIIKEMGETGKRKIPADAPTGFVNDEMARICL